MLRFLQFLAIAGTLAVLAIGTARADDTAVIPPDDGLGSDTPVVTATAQPACVQFNLDGSCVTVAAPVSCPVHHRNHHIHRFHKGGIKHGPQ